MNCYKCWVYNITLRNMCTVYCPTFLNTWLSSNSISLTTGTYKCHLDGSCVPQVVRVPSPGAVGVRDPLCVVQGRRKHNVDLVVSWGHRPTAGTAVSVSKLYKWYIATGNSQLSRRSLLEKDLLQCSTLFLRKCYRGRCSVLAVLVTVCVTGNALWRCIVPVERACSSYLVSKGYGVGCRVAGGLCRACSVLD